MTNVPSTFVSFKYPRYVPAVKPASEGAFPAITISLPVVFDKVIELSEEKNGSYYFPYTWFKIGHNEYFYPNWYSGMAQGRWLSYFSQLYLETKNEKCLWNGFLVAIANTVTVESVNC